MKDAAFSRRALFAIFGIAIASFAVGLFFAVKGKDPAKQVTHGANSYSHSAVGHRAFVRVLRRIGAPSVTSQYSSAQRASGDAVLVLLEPAPKMGRVSLRDMLGTARRVFIVLPKWRWIPDPENERWIGAAALEPPSAVVEILDAVLPLDVQANIVRIPASVPRQWQTGTLAIEPVLGNLQLLNTPGITPIVSTEHGVLLGEVETDHGKVLILSDPDLISNHGLAQGDNALLALRALDYLRDGRGSLIIDETLHGYQTEPSIWRALFEFPLVLATLTAAISLLLLLWAAVGRFGAPTPAPPVIEPGKAFLIDNTASLLQFGEHGSYTLSRYLTTALQDVAERLHAPGHLQGEALQAWLERVATTRGVRLELSQIVSEIAIIVSARRPSERNIVLAANRLYSWKREILRGSTGHPAS